MRQEGETSAMLKRRFSAVFVIIGLGIVLC